MIQEGKQTNKKTPSNFKNFLKLGWLFPSAWSQVKSSNSAPIELVWLYAPAYKLKCISCQHFWENFWTCILRGSENTSPKGIDVNAQAYNGSSVSALFAFNENKPSLAPFPGNYQEMLNLTWGSRKPHITAGNGWLYNETSLREQAESVYLILVLINIFPVFPCNYFSVKDLLCLTRRIK